MTRKESSLPLDVIVVGAGLSGLTAAHELQQAGLSCLVLEARDRVGGKTWSIDTDGNGKIVDVGAAWINDSNQSEVFALARALNLELITQNTVGHVVQEDIDGSISTFPYGGLPKFLSEEHGVDKMVDTRAHFEETCQQLDIRNLGLADPKLDQQSLRDWIIASKGHSRTVLASASVWTRAMLGLELHEVSALYFLDYCKSGGGLLSMRTDHKHGGQYLRFVKGTQSLSLGLVKLLKPGSVILQSPVRAIQQAEPHITVTTATSVYTASRVIVSLPTPLYTSITFTPPLPPAKLALSQNTRQGYTTKVMVLYARPWWRQIRPDLQLCGLLQSWRGPITVTRDSSIDAKQQYSLTCFLVGDLGRDLSKLSQTERFAAVKEHIARTFGTLLPHGQNVPESTDVVEYEWSKDEWSQGCPVPAMPPGVLSRYGSELRNPVGGIHFVGTETSYEWKGYMDGAIRSGRRGAEEVIAALKSSTQAKP